MNRAATDYDMAVVGAGPIGAVAAATLAKHAGVPAQRIALIAPEALVVAAGAPVGAAASAVPDLRVAAISRASERLLRNAGAWPHLPPERLCAYESMRVWHESMPSDGPEVLAFEAAEMGEPNLGHIVENRALAAAGLASFTESGGKVVAERLTAMECDERCARLTINQTEITARLVVAADGAQSRIREWLRLPMRGHDYRQSAIVATVGVSKSHRRTAWQRFLRSGPLAFLPLYDGSCSIVWTVDQKRAEALMAATPLEFSAELEAASDRVLGATTLLSERLMIPLRRATAVRLVGARVALIGDAAHVIHPLAGQGVNLGFLDTASLCEVLAAGIAEGEDPGADRLLTRYEQQRLTHNALMSGSMSVFNTVFSRAQASGWFAARLLGLAGASGLARRAFARQALGLAGGLPPLAQLT